MRYNAEQKAQAEHEVVDMEMAGNGRVMTYDNLTDVPLQAWFGCFSCSLPLSIYQVHAGWWWFSLSLVQRDRGPPRGNITDLRRPVIMLHHDGTWIKGELHYHRCELSIA